MKILGLFCDVGDFGEKGKDTMHHDSEMCVKRSDIHDMKGTEALMFAIRILGAHGMADILGVHDMGEIGVGNGLRDVMREQERF